MSANKLLWLGRLFYCTVSILLFCAIISAGPLFSKPVHVEVSVLLTVIFVVGLAVNIQDMEMSFMIFSNSLGWLIVAWLIGEVVFWHLLPTNSMGLSLVAAIFCGIIGGGGLAYLDVGLLLSAVDNNPDCKLIMNGWFLDYLILGVLPCTALCLLIN